VTKNKWLLVALYAIAAALCIIYRNELLIWIQKPGTPVLLPALLVATLIALVPVIPYGVVGAVIGAKFGFLVGSFINVAASTIAAVIIFALVRVSFADGTRRLLTRYKNIERFTRYVEEHPFLAVLFARLIPIVPAQAVNIYAGLSKMKLSIFLFATIIGKIPVMITFALAGDQVFKDAKNTLIVIGVYLAFLLVVFGSYRIAQSRANGGSSE